MAEMKEKQSSAVIPAMVVASLIGTAFLVAYVAGYFWLEVKDFSSSQSTAKFYETQWQADLFGPAAQVEAWIRGEKVTARRRRTIR
jgi:hypothetical protein